MAETHDDVKTETDASTVSEATRESQTDTKNETLSDVVNGVLEKHGIEHKVPEDGSVLKKNETEEDDEDSKVEDKEELNEEKEKGKKVEEKVEEAKGKKEEQQKQEDVKTELTDEELSKYPKRAQERIRGLIEIGRAHV